MITARRLTKRFNGVTAVEDLSLELREGEVLALLGPNGAGKTTTVRMLSCLIAPTSGEATVCGHGVGRDDDAIRRNIGILTEVPGLYERLTARQNLELYARLHGVPDVPGSSEKYLRLLDLWDRRDEPAGTFSKGMKQKLAIARALVHEPRVLFLDEPTSGLDPQMARTVREFIGELRAQGRTILLCTHNLEEAERLCDRVALIRTRLVALDRPTALRARLFGQHTMVRLRRMEPHLVNAVRELDFVTEVRVSDDSLLVALEDPETHNPDLIRRLVAEGAEVVSVTAREHSLEDIYLKLIEAERPQP